MSRATPEEIADAVAEVVRTARRLLGEGGCPWDREQTIETMTPYLVEESHEVTEAIAHDDGPHLAEELGDLLFLVIFLSELAEARYGTSLAEVARQNVAKLVRRHPHVFANASAESAQQVLRRWEELKRAEKAATTSAPPPVLGRAPKGLPALVAAYRTQEKAAAAGFDWPDAQAAFGKVDEEIAELRAALASGKRDAIEHEIGDALFALATCARHLRVDPEQALHAGVRRYRTRFEQLAAVAAARGDRLSDLDDATLLTLWRGTGEQNAIPPSRLEEGSKTSPTGPTTARALSNGVTENARAEAARRGKSDADE
jgi:MazG family protein